MTISLPKSLLKWKDYGFGIQLIWVLIQALISSSCMACGKSFNFTNEMQLLIVTIMTFVDR